jgi:5-methylcytosine-specific restriction endonuclease McrA
MKENTFKFYEPTAESCFRSSILIGDNDKCYKFALGKSLLYFAKQNKSEISINELSSVYTSFICEHLKKVPIQGTNRKPPGKVLIACDKFNKNIISKDELIDITKKDEWVVLKKFHLIKGGYLPLSFFYKEKNGKSKKIILTDNLHQLSKSTQFENLDFETEGRWNLLERSWQLKIPYHLLMVEYDSLGEKLFSLKKDLRINITGIREGLNGYQKGKCFYCLKKISIKKGANDISNIDHFFPLKLEKKNILKNLNGVWNLVLSCRECNSGENGKFDKLVQINFLEKLNLRNNYLISSHDPLRQVLIMQTGVTSQKRFEFLNNVFKKAAEFCIFHDWKPKYLFAENFYE